MKPEDIQNLVEQNEFTRENTGGMLSDACIDELNIRLSINVIMFEPEPMDDDSALEIIKTISDRLTNEL